jgi:hypothetical protein
MHSLHSALTERLAGAVDADLEHSPADQIARAVKPVIERAAHDHERALVACVEQALGTGGAASAGLNEVLSTVQQDRVEALLLPEHSNLIAGLCPRSAQITSSATRPTGSQSTGESPRCCGGEGEPHPFTTPRPRRSPSAYRRIELNSRLPGGR